MPLDTRIILAGKPIELDNPMDVQARAIKLRDLQRGEAAAMQADADRKTLADLYRENMGADGATDDEGMVRGLAQRGQGASIPAYHKQMQDRQTATSEISKRNADTQKTEFETHKNKVDFLSQGYSSLLSRENVTIDDAYEFIHNAVQNNVISPGQGAEAARKMPGRPEQLRPFLIQRARENAVVAKQMDDVAKSNADRASQEERGRLDRKGRLDVANLVTNAGVTYKTDENGNIVSLPNRPGAGPVSASPVTNAAGQPLRAQESIKLTEEQGKSAGWLADASNALADMASAIGEEKGADRPGAADFLASIPSLGATTAVANLIRSPARQKYIAATETLTDNLLHAATGAGFSKEEALKKIHELTPDYNESEASRTQKLKQIPVFIETLKLRAGPSAAKKVTEIVELNRAPSSPAQTPSGATHSGW